MLRSASTRPPSTQEGIIATLRKITALIRSFRRACILSSAAGVCLCLIVLSRTWSRRGSSNGGDIAIQLPQPHEARQDQHEAKLALTDSSPSASSASRPAALSPLLLLPSSAPSSLPSSLRALMEHDQSFFCSVAPYLTLKETVEKRVTLTASALEPPSRPAPSDSDSADPSSSAAAASELSWLMHLLPFGRDIVSTELHSQRGWDSHKTREMLLLMQGALPQLNYSVARARRFVRSDPMGPEEAQRLFVDVGANIGWFSLSLAAAGYRVTAFEPLQHNALALRSSLCRNAGLMPPARVQFYPLGLGESEQLCAVYSASRNVGDGHVVCRSEQEVAEAKAVVAQRAAERAARRAQQAPVTAADSDPAPARRRLLSAREDGVRHADSLSTAAPRSVPQSPSLRSGIPLEKLKSYYRPPARKSSGKGSQAQQPRDREHAPMHNRPAGYKAAAARVDQPTDESPPPLSNSAEPPSSATDDPDFVTVVPTPAGGSPAASVRRTPSTTAQIRHHSLALTREWNTTGLLPSGYFVRNELRLSRLDALITEPVHLLKLDVEGFELRVLRGATALFDQLGVRFVVAEFSPSMLRALGSEPRDLLAFFAQRGYEIRQIVHGFNIDRIVAEHEFDTFCQTEEATQEQGAKPAKGRRLQAASPPRQCELLMLKPQDMASA